MRQYLLNITLLLFATNAQAQYASAEIPYRMGTVGPIPAFVPGGSHNFQFPTTSVHIPWFSPRERYNQTQRGLDPWLFTVKKIRMVSQ